MLVFTLAVVARALLAPPPQGKEQHLEEEEEEEGSGGSADDLPSYLHAPRVPTPEPRPWPTLRSLLTEGAVDAPQPPHPPDGSSLRSHRGGRTRAASPSSRLPPPPPAQKGSAPRPCGAHSEPAPAARGAERRGAARYAGKSGALVPPRGSRRSTGGPVPVFDYSLPYLTQRSKDVLFPG